MAEQETKNASGATESQSGTQQTTNSQETKNDKSENNQTQNSQTENKRTENNQSGNDESGNQSGDQSGDQTGGNQTIKQTGTEIIGQVKERATGLLDEQKTNLTSGLTSVVDSLRQVGENLRGADEQNAVGKFTAQYGDEIARRIEDLSSYVENADFRDIARDVETLARRQPALFIGGAFALGLLAARFLKSSRPNQGSSNRSRNNSGKSGSGGNSSTQSATSGNA